MTSKKETVEEFVARGGQVKVLEAEPFTTTDMVRPTGFSSGANNLMSLDMGELMFGESNRNSKRYKAQHEDTEFAFLSECSSFEEMVAKLALPEDMKQRLLATKESE